MGLQKILTGIGIQRFLNLAAADDADAQGTPLVPIVAGMSAGAEALTATIALAAHESDALQVRGRVIGRFVVPAAFEGGYLQFNHSLDGVAWSPIKDQFGNPLRYTAASGDAVNADPRDFIAAEYLQLVSTDADGNAVNQAGAAAEITVMVAA